MVFISSVGSSLVSGHYRYTGDLLALDAGIPSTSVRGRKSLWEVSTPLIVPAWATALASHPDQVYRNHIISGLTDGFRIGFNRSQPLSSAERNMISAMRNPVVIDKYLSEERSGNRLIGPLEPNGIHLSRFGVIPKGHTPGKWRLITDLSYPPGLSVNDGIDGSFCSLKYLSVDFIAKIVSSLGQGSLMAKVDIQSAYRLIPVHPDDRPLLGVRWSGEIFCDAMLPFGLRSAPKLFNAVADALEWCIRREGVSHVYHYLDDFIVLGPPSSPQCHHDLVKLESVCKSLGVPLAAHKSEGPSTCLTFLGIEIDSVARELRLPADKLQRLSTVLASWADRKTCLRKELESLVGLLNHACKVVRPGRTFLRRMIDLLTATGNAGISRPNHHIRLSREFRADLAWWRLFVSRWNGVGLIQPSIDVSNHQFHSDASGRWGCGAWYGLHWFQYEWDHESSLLDISVKELAPVIMAASVWGSSWRGQTVKCYSDNQAVVAVLNKRSCRDRHLMHMLRCLFYIEAQGQFIIIAEHVEGTSNDKADDLSRDKLSSFLSKVPEADKSPTVLPSQLPRLLLSLDPDWISPSWERQFIATLRRD